MNRRSHSIHRRKRKAESPAEDGDIELAATAEKRVRQEEEIEGEEAGLGVWLVRTKSCIGRETKWCRRACASIFMYVCV